MASDKAPALDVQKDDALDAPVHEVAPAAADRGVSQTSSAGVLGVSAPRSGGVQMKADGVAVQHLKESDSWWERVKDTGSELAFGTGIGSSLLGMSKTPGAGQLAAAGGLGLTLGTMAGEGLWELDKYLSSGSKTEEVKEDYTPDWYNPLTW